MQFECRMDGKHLFVIVRLFPVVILSDKLHCVFMDLH